ncbi:MAG TPA: TetR/AcrR family transcriptional regulator [Streptosporangiaceae bacterium]|nr:TetR/AcrR family transcriptional regulator [Streptosporangiaceae bacterium]
MPSANSPAEPPPGSPVPPPSLRAEQVAQTRAALVAAGRRLFGRQGFAGTSVDDLAREARVTTGALYHHFPNKTKLFEAVFEQAHTELMAASVQAAMGAPDEVELLSRGFEAFLDSAQQPELRQIVIVDAPAVLGLARFTELDEQYAYTEIMYALQSAVDAGRLEVDDPETLTRLLLGALTRGAMLVANSDQPEQTRQSVGRTMRSMLGSFVPRPD